jgi:flagellar basal body P-ring formation protein FlgA
MPKRAKLQVDYPVLVATLVALLVISAGVARGQQPATQRVAVAARTLPRGTVLTANDFTVRDTTLRGPLDTTQVGEGWVTRRLIGAGEVLRMPSVERPRLINANHPLEVEWRDNNVTLTVRGIATRSAALGERIAVRTDSGRRVEATVVAPGRLRLQ